LQCCLGVFPSMHTRRSARKCPTRKSTISWQYPGFRDPARTKWDRGIAKNGAEKSGFAETCMWRVTQLIPRIDLCLPVQVHRQALRLQKRV